MSRLFAFILLVLFCSSASTAYRILCLFPTPATSHQIVYRAYTNALAESGHEIVVATTHPVKNPHPNITQIDWSFVDAFWKENMNFAKNSSLGLIDHIHSYFTNMPKLLDMELSHPEIKEIIQNPEKQKFDLLVVETNFITMSEIAKLLNIPLMVMSSSDPYEHGGIGNYVHAVAAPMRVMSAGGPMTFLERFKSKTFDYVVYIVTFLLNRAYRPIMIKHFGPNVRSISEMVEDIDMLFINVNPSFGYMRPVVPKAITLGFLHITDPKPLSKDLQTYLDGSKNGVIYCSFGTTVLSENVDAARLQTILQGFGRLQYDVLFKFGNDTIKNKPNNVKLVKWIPQADLLAHKNVRLFITQAGQHSIEEAIVRGVPLLAIPFFGDQHPNAKRIAYKEWGKMLNVEKITSDILVDAIEEVITNPLYKENVVKLGKIVADEPMPPRKKAVWWTEYLIRHKGAKHLEYHGVKVPTYQLYYLDVMAAYLAILMVLYMFIKVGVEVIRKMYAKLLKLKKNPTVKVTKID